MSVKQLPKVSKRVFIKTPPKDNAAVMVVVSARVALSVLLAKCLMNRWMDLREDLRVSTFQDGRHS